MAFYNSFAFWHIFNSLWSARSVSTFLKSFPSRVQGGSDSFFKVILLIFFSVANRYDDTRPIDIEYSIIAQKLFNLTVKDH